MKIDMLVQFPLTIFGPPNFLKDIFIHSTFICFSTFIEFVILFCKRTSNRNALYHLYKRYVFISEDVEGRI